MNQNRDDDKLWSRLHPSQELCTRCGRTLLQSRGFAAPGSTASWAEVTKPSIPPAFHSVEQLAISLGRAAPILADQSRHSHTMHHSSKARLRNKESLAVAEEASGGGAVQRPQMPPLSHSVPTGFSPQMLLHLLFAPGPVLRTLGVSVPFQRL